MAPESRAAVAPARRPRLTLVEQELANSLDWLVSLRWLVGGVVVLAAPLATSAFRMPIPAEALTLTGGGILAYNFVLWSVQRAMRRHGVDDPRWHQAIARIQILLDWIAMAVLISLSGGAESPAIVFFLIHITIASLLLPHHLGFLYVSLAPLLVAGVALLEYFEVLPHVAVVLPPRYHEPLFVGFAVGFFTLACYMMAYACMAIARRLRRRETELGGLYESVQEITSTLELDAVLDTIVEAAAHVLGCRAAAIRLIDLARAQVEFAATHGLSERYLEDVPEDFARSRLDQETLRAGVVHVDDVERDDRVWKPERVRDEGIASMLSVTIHGRTGPLGVLRAYGAPGHRFTHEDVTYLQAVAAHGAVAIEHAKAYRLLAELDRDKSRFLRTTTHELRSPVRVTESLLATLADGYAGPLQGEQGELVRRAQRRLAALHMLIDDLLALAAGKADMGALQPRRCDVRGIVAEVVEQFRAVATEKHLTLALSSPGEPLEVWCDPGDLERIVANLVSNAVKYTREGGVTVTLAGEDAHVRLTIADTGIGIPTTAQPHLFQEFYRAGNARQVEESGTGLGLSIVRALVERYGGRVTFASEEHRGTTFSVEMVRASGFGSRSE